MAEYIESLQNLAEQFGHLEGVGRKSAFRMAYSVLDMTEEDAAAFAQAILDAKAKIHLCPVCQNLTDRALCAVCDDPSRDRSLICVVSDPKTVMALERVRDFRGTYHVLHGALSPLNGVTPDKLKIKELLARISAPLEAAAQPVDSADAQAGTPWSDTKDEDAYIPEEVREVIVATNADVEGEATAMYLARLLRPLGVKVTRLAYGISVGTDLEYTDEITLYRAIAGRRDV